MKYSRSQRAELRQALVEPDKTSPEDMLQDNQPVSQDAFTGPIFFWREFEEPYGFLCQWFPAYFRDPSIPISPTFNCAEQYMMWCKAHVLAAPDPGVSNLDCQGKEENPLGGKSSNKSADSRRAKVVQAQNNPGRLPGMVLAEQDPGKQKALARSVRFSPRQLEKWESIKFEVVVHGNYCKFTQNEYLCQRLLATGDRKLVEASPKDDTWGIGFAAEFAELHREDWGSNLLGKALMVVRGRLMAEKREQTGACV